MLSTKGKPDTLSSEAWMVDMGIKILVVSPSPIISQGISALLTREPDFEVTAEAHSGKQALQKIREGGVEMVLMDAHLSDMDGAEVTGQIKERYPQVEVIALSIVDPSDCALNMLRAGALGCLMKNFTIADLREAIHQVFSHQTFICPTSTQLLIEQFQQWTDSRHPPRLSSVLTAREKEVLKLLATGKTNAKIGEILKISSKTVEAHRRNIISKLKVNTVAELTRYAITVGLI